MTTGPGTGRLSTSEVARQALDALTDKTSTVQHSAAESLSMKQSWKDSHWYCDGLTLAPQNGETMGDVLDRFEVLAVRLERWNGRPIVDEEVPF